MTEARVAFVVWCLVAVTFVALAFTWAEYVMWPLMLADPIPWV